MRHVYITGEYRTIAWYGPRRPTPFRHPVCAYLAGDPEEQEFADYNKAQTLARYNARDGIFGAAIEEHEDGRSREDFELDQRIAEDAERRAMQPREYYY